MFPSSVQASIRTHLLQLYLITKIPPMFPSSVQATSMPMARLVLALLALLALLATLQRAVGYVKTLYHLLHRLVVRLIPSLSRLAAFSLLTFPFKLSCFLWYAVLIVSSSQGSTSRLLQPVDPMQRFPLIFTARRRS